MKKLTLAGLVLMGLTAVGCASPTSGSEDGSTTAASELNGGPITLANWLTHPEIVAVREVVSEVDTADFASESQTFCEGSGVGEVERTKLTDANGVIRELVLSYGSEDSSSIESYYYDATGKLRFVFTTRNDVHGNSTELRTYFGANGARLWDVRRHAFSETFNPDLESAPYEMILDEDKNPIDPDVFTPATRYASAPRCD